MKVSGFTIARNIEKYNYPAKEAILAILSVCDEFIINVGESEDRTLEILKEIDNPKIKIVMRKWNDSLGKEMLSHETNFALNRCAGDWAFYAQIDELVHERDLPRLKKYMLKYLDDESIEAIRFKWLHFYGNFCRYRIDPPWFQKQDRIIKNNGTIESYGDAWAFRKKDGTSLRTLKTPCFIYHYGWVSDPKMMAEKRKNAEKIGFAELGNNEKKGEYSFGDLNRFPAYFGTHPEVMKDIVSGHDLSREDWQRIKKRYFWNPLLWFRVRYKTFRREKQAIER